VKRSNKELTPDQSNLSRIIDALRQHGIQEGRLIAFSKTGYRQRHPDHQIICNAMIFTRHLLVLRMVDLDLMLDGPTLTAVAKVLGEDLFVLPQGDPDFSWQPSSIPLRQDLGNAVWWTRIEPANQDVFLPVADAVRLSRRFRLVCTVGTWQGKPAYALNCWENEELYNQNFVGGAVEFLGRPPAGMSTKRCVEENEISVRPSKNRGRRVYPVFLQHSAMLQYIWFSNGMSVPAVLFGATAGRLNSVSYTNHTDVTAIHVREQRAVIGLLWPNSFTPAETMRSAHQELCRVPETGRPGATKRGGFLEYLYNLA
jgi:hypothetical protein